MALFEDFIMARLKDKAAQECSGLGVSKYRATIYGLTSLPLKEQAKLSGATYQTLLKWRSIDDEYWDILADHAVGFEEVFWRWVDEHDRSTSGTSFDKVFADPKYYGTSVLIPILDRLNKEMSEKLSGKRSFAELQTRILIGLALTGYAPDLCLGLQNTILLMAQGVLNDNRRPITQEFRDILAAALKTALSLNQRAAISISKPPTGERGRPRKDKK